MDYTRNLLGRLLRRGNNNAAVIGDEKSSRDWVGLVAAADLLNTSLSRLLDMSKEGRLPAYIKERYSIQDCYQQLKPQEVAQNYRKVFFAHADLSSLQMQMREESELENLRQQLEQERAAREAEALEQAKFHAIELERMRQQIRYADEETKYLRQRLEELEADKRVEFEDAMSIISELRDKAGNAEWLQAELDVLHEKHEAEKAAREAAERRAERAEAEAKPSHLLAIAALLEILKTPVEHPRPQGMNQEAIKAAILDGFPWRGLSDRNLQTIFAAANKAKADVE
ncbi:hypothetical protein [Azotobacter beijerinckii]|uniref:Uncharacterized protein n=1 Tax=Azotobacter beijerinckii TaxID=170623 RepID=A0A1I4C3U0_9GAMM|nr:hypothetical protein [Azotobacter beijerinckii]SFB58273.1 hypothetical protein SAMN04244571_04004 [Azotobacter beijerinckii]SFK75057.1 hypothetical protein SAMN04244574_01742 [Azotobacter beijerinckii]